MATPSTQRAALMSIRPLYVDAILDGSKLVEFRKRRLASDVTRVVIYTTAPVQAVVGEFSISEQITASPERLWRRFSKVAGIDRRAFFEYFSETTEAVGILIDSVKIYDPPQSLEEYEPGTRPPQSFKYVNVA